MFIEKGSQRTGQKKCLTLTVLFLFQYPHLQIQRLLLSGEFLVARLTIYKVYSTFFLSEAFRSLSKIPVSLERPLPSP